MPVPRLLLCPQAALHLTALPPPPSHQQQQHRHRRDTSTAAASTSSSSAFTASASGSGSASSAAAAWRALPSAFAAAPRSSSTAAVQRSPRLNVLCMAHPRRVAKVTSQIQRELGDMLVNDAVVINALSPERAQGEDLQLSVVPSITHVYVSNDLQVVKAYISIYSDDFGKKRAMSNLQRLEPYVRKQMGQRVPLRLTPEYRFVYDGTLDEMELVQKVIGEVDVARYKRELAEEFGEDEVEEEVEGGAVGFEQDNDDDDDGFFAADEVGEQEYQEISSSDIFQRPGPFDDLFSGSGDQLVQSRSSAMPPPEQRGKGKGKGKKKGQAQAPKSSSSAGTV